MAKSKQKAVKTPQKRSTKYGKLAAVCSKELAAKKAALVRAEKAFANAQKNHTELLAEVARLDMLDRSLKALINGTEAPQNVRYVYNYPQWVWYGNPYGWYWNGNTYTVTLGAQSGYPSGSFQGGQFNYNTAGSISTTNAVNTITTPVTSGALNLTNLNGGLTLSNASSGFTFDSNSSGLSNAVLTSTPATSYTMTTTGLGSGSPIQPELTVDLSSGASDPDAEKVEAVETPVWGENGGFVEFAEKK